jgi:hypothetical protein
MQFQITEANSWLPNNGWLGARFGNWERVMNFYQFLQISANLPFYFVSLN